MVAGRVHSTCEEVWTSVRNARRSSGLDLRGDTERGKKRSQVEWTRPAQRQDVNGVGSVKKNVCEYL